MSLLLPRRFASRLFAVAGTLLLLISGFAHSQSPWKLVWSDEFNGAVGTPPDPAKWRFEAGPGSIVGGGNEEAETYCAPNVEAPPCKAGQPNAYLDGRGHLIIVAVKTDQTVIAGAKKIVSPVYTSARMISTASFQYGRLEASIRLPVAGRGVWPSFWALGEEKPPYHWPTVGEIDVFEQWNPVMGTNTVDPLIVHGAVHGPKAPGTFDGFADHTAEYKFPKPPSGGLHQFAVEWGPGQVDFYIDGYLYESQSVATMTGKEVWEQDRQPFNLLLNLAMGGGFFGYPDESTERTPTMVVDYVRVYQRDPGALPAGWGNYDAGGPAVAGSAVFRQGLWTVDGSGVGIAGGFDQFQFVYHGLAGDGEVHAHVLDQTGKVAQAKAGVMVREDRGAASPYAMMFVSPDSSVHFRYRSARGEMPSEVLYKGKGTWLKVGRQGNVFTGYVSVDGKTWTPVGDAKLTMPVDTTAGLIVTSRDNGAPNSVRFDYVDITRNDSAYDGQALTLPGVLQAERFDTGGATTSYSKEFGDAGPEIKQIVSGTGEDSASGFYLASVPAGRYINYSVTVPTDGNYVVTTRASSPGTGGSFHMESDRKAIFKPVTIGESGHWVEVKSPPFHLAAGHHILALITDTGMPADFDFFNVQAQ